MNSKVVASLSVIVALLAGFLVIAVMQSTKITPKRVVPQTPYTEPVGEGKPESATQAPQTVKTSLDTHSKEVKTSLKVAK